METNETEIIDSPIDTETTENTEEVEVTPEKYEALKKDYEKALKEAETLKVQKAKLKEKAQKEKEDKDEVVVKGITDTDLLALVRANVADDDLEEVKTFAGFKGISIAEALKNKTLQTILSDRAEERKTAQAANTKSARSVSRVTDDVILEKASKGEISESDIDKLTEARMNARLKARG